MQFPLSTGSASAFAIVREFLAQSPYREQPLLDYFRVPSLHQLLFAHSGLDALYTAPGLLPFLARLFFGGYPVTARDMELHLPAPVQAALQQLGLLTNRRSCPVLLYPALGFWVCADRGDSPAGPGYDGSDYVMSGIESICLDHIRFMSTSPCERFLDLGTGSGLTALTASRFATHVWAVDITPRAVRFADFNCRLNGVENVTILQGDLYQPVATLQFDRIGCNPPLEPPLKSNMIFSVGGADGEALIARVIAGAPAHLSPNGRLYCNIAGTDREHEPFDQRVTRWLGAAAAVCDTALFVRESLDPAIYALEQVVITQQPAAQLAAWDEFYRSLGAKRVIIAHVVIQSVSNHREPFRCRYHFGPATGSDQMEALLDWQSFSHSSPIDRLTFRDGGNWELHVQHEPKDGDLIPTSYQFVTQHPFDATLSVPAWAAALVNRADGATAVGDLLPSPPPSDAAFWIRQLVDTGLLLRQPEVLA